jgi:Ca2+-binding EF-hand superfamily protein
LVDEDGSGSIEFNEFLSILKNTEGGEQVKAIKKFFEGLAKGQYGDMNIAFSNYVLERRRRSLIDALKSSDKSRKEQG